ncbi:MAG: hypothetical protein HY278_04505 [candidate division NC10 bacterium]|nr:hypothetical protein [candidate division NC10 bacterium]
MKAETANGSRGRTLGGYLWLASALVVCPCHLPLLLALAGGTTFAALLQANWHLAVALSMGYVIVALLFAFRVLSREKGCAIPGVGNNPVLALALSALLPGFGQGYNRQWIKAGAFMAAGTASAWPLLSPARLPDSFASLALRLVLPTMLLAAFEIWSMVDAYHVARARVTR